MNKPLKSIILCLLAISIAACSATPTRRTFKEGWQDSAITSKIKWRMGRDETVKAGNIDVDTWRGVVTLTGRVTSEAEKGRAGQIASGIKSVKGVRNYLDIVGPESVPQKVAKGNAPFSKPKGKFKEAGEITPPVIAAPTKPAAKAATPKSAEKLSEKGITETNITEKPAIEKPLLERPDDGVSYHIRNELAVSETPKVSEEEIVSQAQKELEELKEKKQEARR